MPDAAIPDAYVPDTPESVTCATGEMNCNGNCANVMTSELFCGNCTTQCSPTQGCLNGSCVPANTTCARVRELDPTAPDGAYTNPNTGAQFYCDYTNNMTYEGFGLGLYTSGYAGYVQMSSANFNDPQIQKAFIGLYNAQTGLINLQIGFNVGNCCMKAADAAAGQMLHLAGKYLYPAYVTMNSTDCGGAKNQARYRFFEAEAGPYSPIPMPDDWFATHPATVAASCGDNANPAVFMRRRTGLN